MTQNDAGGVSKPTIAEVLKQFLADQRARVAAKTLGQYEYIVDLLQHSLNGYAYQTLDESDAELFKRLSSGKGAERREFCEIFGPEHILPNVGEFLDYFMVRKVVAGHGTLRAAGTVTKRLAKWLAGKGYIRAEEAEDAAESASGASRNLPEAARLSTLLHDFAENQESETGDDEVEGHFTITRVEPGKLWLEPLLEDRQVGPILVPEEISSRCKPGWSISGIVGRSGKTWQFVEAWNVYPA